MKNERSQHLVHIKHVYLVDSENCFEARIAVDHTLLIQSVVLPISPQLFRGLISSNFVNFEER